MLQVYVQAIERPTVLGSQKGSLKDIQVVSFISCDKKHLNYNLDSNSSYYNNNVLSNNAFEFEYAEFTSVLEVTFRMLNKS